MHAQVNKPDGYRSRLGYSSNTGGVVTRLTICRMRNRRFSKDIRAINFRFRKEDPQKVDKVYLFQF